MLKPCTLESANRQAYSVVSREVSDQPRAMPELLDFDVGEHLSMGWGTRNPERSPDRIGGYWNVIKLSSSQVSCVLAGLALVGAAFLLGRAGLAIELEQDSAWVPAFVLTFCSILALGGIRIMLEPWSRLSTRLPPTASPGPWQQDYGWREVVRTENGAGHREGLTHLIKSFVFLPVILGIMVMIHLPLFLAPDQLPAVQISGTSFQVGGTTTWMAVVAVFDLLMLAALGAMIYTLIQWLRFGRPRFTVLTLPARPGERLQAELEFSRGVPASGETFCALHCIDASTTRSAYDDNHRGALVSLYRDVRQLDTKGHRVYRLHFDFKLPKDVPSTSIQNQPRRIWRLIVRIPTRGLNYRGEFLVPVYGHEDSSS